jgi:hypothetical protein
MTNNFSKNFGNLKPVDLRNFFMKDRLETPIFYLESSPLLNDLFVETASEMDMEIFKYSGKNYIEISDVKFEAELHFDGVTAPATDRVPDFVAFEFLENPESSIINDYFYLVDGVKLAELADSSTKNFLSQNKLAIRGMQNRVKQDWRADFEIPLLRCDFGDERILGHIPTLDLNKLSVSDGWLYSSNEGLSFKFVDCSVEKTISIIFELHDLINSNDDVVFRFVPKNGLAVIVDNKRIMHGRSYGGRPYERLMRRTQLKIC